MSDRSIMIQLPEALLAAIDIQAELTGNSRTETIVKILQQAVENIPTDRDPKERILFRVEALEQKVADLVDRLDGKVLEELALEELKVQLSALERGQPLPVNGTTNDATVETQTTPETIANSLVGSELKNFSQGEWMTVKEAFAWLGGEPKDPSSGVTSLDGRRSVSFNRFRVLKAPDYQVFGLEFQSDRRRQQMPCLRPWRSLVRE